MTDQLDLRLDDDRPALPRTLRPMLPRSVAGPFDDPDHLFEPWWGGARAFAYVEVDAATGVGSVRIVDRRGRDRAPLLPELTATGGLVGRLGGHAAVLDGCLVVVDARGRPDPAALERRLAGSPGATVVYLAFDLVALDGRPLLAEPLERRRERLERTVETGGSVLVVPAIPTEGRALHAAAGAQGVPAIIGRHRRSPYLPGVRSRLWRLVGTDAALAPPADAGGTGAPASGTVPVLALIQRLPLELGE
jgi:bifunctional non-homologous end joining protein LigD